MPNPLSIQIGERYGRWTIIKAVPSYKKVRRFQCKCDCGTIRDVNITTIVHGKSKSCGCSNKERAKYLNYKNGLYKTRLHCIWQNMTQRCYNPKREEYSRYGGKGISICEEWHHDFKSFYDWSIDNGYADNLSIDRINGSGNYEPSNCRWATISQQNCNLSSNHLITYCGETKPIAVWSRELGFNHKTLEKRIKKWGVERAFTTPIQVEFQRKRKSS